MPHTSSLPLWKCGLKLMLKGTNEPLLVVTSLVEVWIEMSYIQPKGGITYRHFPCGSVD